MFLEGESLTLKSHGLEIKNSKVSPVGNGPYKSIATDSHGNSGIRIGIIGASWWWCNVV